jgi:hypothetical protein
VPEAVEEYFSQLLALSEYPAGFPCDYQIAYRQEPRELVIEYRLPPADVIPRARDFRYVKTRGEILIQAKRYSKCVPTNDVRALAGSVEEKRATSGVLVTTAWVSAETKAFAARNNRLRIIEGGELKHLLAEYLNLDVRIDLARRPRRIT